MHLIFVYITCSSNLLRYVAENLAIDVMQVVDVYLVHPPNSMSITSRSQAST